MPRTPEDNAQIRDARRREILDAAARVFATHGFARTKVADIAAAAGLSYGLVYHYFDGKGAIFDAIVDAMIERIQATLEVPAASAYEQLATAIRESHARLTDPQRNEADRLVSQAMLQPSAPIAARERLQQHAMAFHRRTTALIERAQQDGDVDASLPADELARSLIFMFRGMSIRLPVESHRALELPSVDSILRLVLPPPATTKVNAARPRATGGEGRPRGRKKGSEQ